MVEILVGYLLFFLFVQTEAGACQKFSERNVAEQACKRRQACTNCSDFNFGDDCTSNKKEHCAEIGCCPVCETEIRAMFACEHGDSCGKDLACGVVCDGMEAKEAVEQACRAKNGCADCDDFNFNFGDDCTNNRKGHSIEIGCCPECEKEIRASYACEHGDWCGKDFVCDTTTTTTMLTVNDNESQRSSHHLTYMVVGAIGLLVMGGVTMGVHFYCKAQKSSDVVE